MTTKTTKAPLLRSVWVRVGLGLLIVGSGPLLFIIVAAAIGLWPDPNPNPIGPGLLFFFTFWPAVICIAIGVVRVHLHNRRHVGNEAPTKRTG